MALWTFQDQQDIKPIDQHNEHRFDQIQRETQEGSLRNLIGVQMYNEVMNDQAKFATLIDGGEFYDGAYLITFKGLRYVCAYLFYANYVRQSFVTDTFTGFQQYQQDGATRISGGTIEQLAKQSEIQAGTYFDDCKYYLRLANISSFYPQKDRKSIKIDSL
jgi:hypothetical protein